MQQTSFNTMFVVPGAAFSHHQYPQQVLVQTIPQLSQRVNVPHVHIPQPTAVSEMGVRDIASYCKRLVTTNIPSCCHNRWSLQIRKKRYYVFECMTCSALWKTKLTGTQKCLDFFAGHCPNGDSCKYPHIYSKRALNFNKEESSLETFRSSGVSIGGCSPLSKRSDENDLNFILSKVQKLAEEEELNESMSESGSLSCNSSCYVSCSEK
eukprot:TRINITY_DN5417_c0_g1_i1.p1 TRINITY_DN5417_c0_g1~~TRINITY_DN5417_c0_g1_i1.p1  ORF type:complete len:226 (+),score=52.89 TRINITY_DN5417_c0_g1_i1:54-680(+)